MSTRSAHAASRLPPDASGTEGREQSSGFLFQLNDVPAGALPAGSRVVADPFRMAHEFPDRWQRYLVENYRSDTDTAAAFGVTERTARKWRQGIGGCNGDKVAIAVERHREVAIRYLFAAE